MSELLDRLLELTEDALGRLDLMAYEELEQWVNDREALISEIRMQPPESFRVEERRRKAQQELHLAAELIARMEDLREEASSHLNRVETARVQRSAYDVTYTPDSFFIDKKK
ncbi:hypothetical protein [Gorillibacterium timonense]|uniref:hypothetical protein n=1 Tax=Gorillibacterium timonense TaxID=1689269 RepID=UPI00071CD3E1|nr:hypothetical protein [Gorillibacterium timonense]